jgi:uncharacterized repeat protein (TIGR01451 family)
LSLTKGALMVRWGARRRLPGPATALAAAVLGLALVGAGVTSAVARTPSVSATCDALSVSLTGYDNAAPNHVRVVVDASTAADEAFGSGYLRTFPAPDRTLAYHYRVEVVAHDDPQGTLGWTTAYEGDSVPCAPAGPTPTLEAFANPTTSAAAPTQVQPGAPINYTIRVGNSGGLPIADAPVVDTLPTGATLLAGTLRDGGALGPDGRTITWAVTLAPGATRTLTFAVTVDESAEPGSTLVDTVTFQGLTGSTTHQVPAGALTLGAIVDALPGQGLSVQPGDTLTYTLTVTAAGGLDQADVVVTDYLPGHDPARPGSGRTSYLAGSAACIGPGPCTVTGPEPGGLLTWSVGRLAAGTSRQVTFGVTVDSPTEDGQVVPDVLDAAHARSARTPDTASPELRTPITEVLAVSVTQGAPPTVVRAREHRAEAATLPRTGGPVPVRPALGLAAALLAVGLLLVRAGRRREPLPRCR